MMTKTNYSNIDCVVGIDFGSILSGISYSFITEFEPICCHVNEWPKQKKFLRGEKVPTACLYDKKNKTFIRWGREALDYYKYKRQQQGDMILVENFNENLRASLESNSENQFYQDAALYFFLHMLLYSKKEIYRHSRDTEDPILFYVLSVPHNWSKVASAALKRLFIESILDSNDHFEIIQHSQAAVSFCQNTKTYSMPGANYLLCDFGGTTCDTVIFEQHGPNKIVISDNQLIEPIIALGSSDIDIKMMEYISQVMFNNDPNAIEENSSLIRDMVDYFIYCVKPFVCGDKQGFTTLPTVFDDVVDLSSIEKKPLTVPQFTENGPIFPGELLILYKDMCTYVFDPVIDKIIALIRDIILENMIEVVIITGGFSKSRYLQSKLKEFAYRGIICDFIIKEDTATMDGAVYYGLNKIKDAEKNL